MDVSTDEVRMELRSQTTTTVSTSVTTATTTTTPAGSPGMTTVIINAGNDSAFIPPPFWGVDYEDAGVWYVIFTRDSRMLRTS